MNKFTAKILLAVCQSSDFFGLAKSGVPVLLYHSISNRRSRLAVNPLVFEKQIAYLAYQGYQTILPLELEKVWSLNKKGKQYIVITFDDGFADNLTVAEPILAQYGFKATVFITAKYIGGQSEYAQKEDDKHFKMLSQAEIKELENRGWLIANHFYSHRNLVDLDKVEIEQEFLGAKQILDPIIKNKQGLNIVSYPRNKYNDKAIKIIKRLGAQMGFAGERVLANSQANIMALPRIEIDREVDFAKFRLYLSPSFYRLRKIAK